MDKALFLVHLDLFARSRMTLIGYYSLMPNLEGDLPEVLAAIRGTGCRTALDAAGSGGGLAAARPDPAAPGRLFPKPCRGRRTRPARAIREPFSRPIGTAGPRGSWA